MIRALLAFCLTFTLYPGHVRRAIDGDTVELWHVGVPPVERLRILHVDTPERGQPGFDDAKRFTLQWLDRDTSTVRVCRRDSFGRLLADFTRNADTLAVALITAGLGVRDDR